MASSFFTHLSASFGSKDSTQKPIFFVTFPSQISGVDIQINLKWCWQRCPSSWGRLLAEIRESSPIVPESGRILAELRQSPLLSNLHPPPARVAGYFRRRGRGREPPDPSFRVTCPLKCHGAHQLYEAPLFLVSCPTKKYSTAMCSLVPCTPFLVAPLVP